MSLGVSIEDLSASGVAVTGLGEDMAARHAAADCRIDAAHAGWQGLSAATLSARSDSWLATTNALLARLSDHAQGLHTSAQSFCEMEQRHSQALEVPARAARA
jgi:uncharacterized protein YukE